LRDTRQIADDHAFGSRHSRKRFLAALFIPSVQDNFMPLLD